MGTKGTLLPAWSPELVWSVTVHTAHGWFSEHSFMTGFTLSARSGLVQTMLSLTVRDWAEGHFSVSAGVEPLRVPFQVLGTQLVTSAFSPAASFF